MSASKVKGFRSNMGETAPALRSELVADVSRLTEELRQAKEDLAWIEEIITLAGSFVSDNNGGHFTSGEPNG